MLSNPVQAMMMLVAVAMTVMMVASMMMRMLERHPVALAVFVRK
jgi:hypothetical protein